MVSLYVPSGSSSPERLGDQVQLPRARIAPLERLATSGRDVIICGDWNIAHKEIDLKNWRSNQKNPGFLPEERAWLTGVIDILGYVDVFRRLDPTTGAIHLVVEPRPGLGQQRRVAPRLSTRHARDSGKGDPHRDLSGEALLGSRADERRL